MASPRGILPRTRRMRPAFAGRGAANEILAEDLRADASLDRSGSPTTVAAPIPPRPRIELLEERVGELEALVKDSQERIAQVQQSLRLLHQGKKVEKTTALLRAKTELLIVEGALQRGRLGPAKAKAVANG
jgi:hypothetical protein